MRLFKREPDPPPIDRRRSLRGVPVVNRGVAISGGAEENLTVTVTLPRGRGWLARFGPRTLRRRVELDEFGSFVMRQIDGHRDVLAIVEAFSNRFGTNRRETELSVVAFLKSLIRRRIVSIAVDTGE